MRVKLSSESAGYIAMTPVVLQEFSFSEFLEQLLGATGKDAVRVSELLRRGSLVAGASRFRWDPLQIPPDELQPWLERLPGPEPMRAFRASDCVRVVLCGPSTRLEVTREMAEPRRLFQPQSYWNALLAEATAPQYVTYHYRERSDQFRLALDGAAIARLKNAAHLLKFDGIRKLVASAAFDAIEFYVVR